MAPLSIRCGRCEAALAQQIHELRREDKVVFWELTSGEVAVDVTEHQVDLGQRPGLARGRIEPFHEAARRGAVRVQAVNVSLADGRSLRA